jgi:hypothetical protein
MRRKYAAIGFAALILVLAIVLILVSRSVQRVSPTAIAVGRPCPEGASAAECAPAAPGDLPDLHGLRRSVDDHAGDVKDALAAVED